MVSTLWFIDVIPLLLLCFMLYETNIIPQVLVIALFNCPNGQWVLGHLGCDMISM